MRQSIRNPLFLAAAAAALPLLTGGCSTPTTGTPPAGSR
jgi:hypothetical protein